MPEQKYQSPPVPLPSAERMATEPRTVIEFTGVEQAGPSYEARVFLNNPDAGPDTPKTEENGYVGSFHVYGYGLPPGQPVPTAAKAGRPHKEEAVTPMRRTLVATEALRKVAQKDSTATVTVVPVLPGGVGKILPDTGDLLKIDGVSIRTEAEPE